jgi:hypothetical protein
MLIPIFLNDGETEDRTPLSHSRAACMATTVSRCHRAILLRRWITSRGDFPYLGITQEQLYIFEGVRV